MPPEDPAASPHVHKLQVQNSTVQYSNSTVQYSAGVPGVEEGELARGHVQLVRDLHLQRPRAATITL